MGAHQMEEPTEKERLSTMILSEVAEEENLDPIEVSPKLYTAIDTDALEALFSGTLNGPAKVEFQYAGHHVIVRGDEIVQVTVE